MQEKNEELIKITPKKEPIKIISKESAKPEKISKRIAANEVFIVRNTLRTGLVIGIAGILITLFTGIINSTIGSFFGLLITGILSYFLVNNTKEINRLKQEYNL